MNEGLLNRGLAGAVARQGHGDEMLICDAGFAIPDNVEVVDLSLAENQPSVESVLSELLKYHSVEKLIVADMTEKHNPRKLQIILELLPPGIPMEVISHPDLKLRATKVKTVVRTGDFNSFSNFLLISGAGGRWRSER